MGEIESRQFRKANEVFAERSDLIVLEITRHELRQIDKRVWKLRELVRGQVERFESGQIPELLRQVVNIILLKIEVLEVLQEAHKRRQVPDGVVPQV